MPAVRFLVKWPDGEQVVYYSPSTIILEHLKMPSELPMQEFLPKVDKALDEASERVYEKFGYYCSAASGEQEKIRKKADELIDYFRAIQLIHRCNIMHALATAVPAIEGPKKHLPVIIIGAGQAGMSMSYCLTQKGIDHLVLEKSDRVAHNWQDQRWDAFCLVTPNWQCQLPGFPYQGDDPEGFMVKDEIIEYLESYYPFCKPPLEFNSPVVSLEKQGGGFNVFTPTDYYRADQVVLACGGYHEPKILPFSKQIPQNILQIHSKDYKNAAALPEGEVMVIGTGQSGCQIAEDLHLEGRKVHLCVGTAPRVNRRYRGKDVVKWLDEMGYYETTIDKHPEGDNAPHATNHYVTGRDGGRDLNLRIFAEQGMALYGKLETIQESTVYFKDDLKSNLDYADDTAARIRASIEDFIQKNNIPAPEDNNLHSNYLPDSPASLDLNASKISTIVWATGFNMNFDWIKFPVLNAQGHPQQKRGVSGHTGLYFLGLNWMHTWGSGRFFHVGKDAEYLADTIAYTIEHTQAMSAAN